VREVLCAGLAHAAGAIRRLQRHIGRQRRANNPDNDDERGRIKKHGDCGASPGNTANGRLSTRRLQATHEQRLAAHRKSLHGRLVHEIVAVGTTILAEKIAYRAWQKHWGRSVGLRAPGMCR
jgi:hypothetical protein